MGSHRESMRLEGAREQAITRPLPHDELVQLHVVSAEARIPADLAGQRQVLACVAWWSTCGVLGHGDPVLSDYQGPFQAAAAANDWYGGQPAGDGRSGLGCTRLQHLVPTAEDFDCPIPYRRADGPQKLLVDRTGIKFLGDGEWQARKHGV